MRKFPYRRFLSGAVSDTYLRVKIANLKKSGLFSIVPGVTFGISWYYGMNKAFCKNRERLSIFSWHAQYLQNSVYGRNYVSPWRALGILFICLPLADAGGYRVAPQRGSEGVALRAILIDPSARCARSGWRWTGRDNGRDNGGVGCGVALPARRRRYGGDDGGGWVCIPKLILEWRPANWLRVLLAVSYQ